MMSGDIVSMASAGAKAPLGAAIKPTGWSSRMSCLPTWLAVIQFAEQAGGGLCLDIRAVTSVCLDSVTNEIAFDH
jgi:hypothetical protein